MNMIFVARHLKKLQTDWRGDLFDAASGFETTGRGVDREGHDVVGTLIRDEQELAGRVEREVARPFAFRGNMLHEVEFAGARIDLKDDDAVVTAIRAVKKLAGTRDVHVRAVTCAVEVAGES